MLVLPRSLLCVSSSHFLPSPQVTFAIFKYLSKPFKLFTSDQIVNFTTVLRAPTSYMQSVGWAEISFLLADQFLAASSQYIHAFLSTSHFLSMAFLKLSLMPEKFPAIGNKSLILTFVRFLSVASYTIFHCNL